MKYIQDTDWFKKTRETAVKALDQQWQETMDKTIIEALRARGPSEKAKPPKGRAVTLSTTSQELFMKSEGC